jgi:hypothetical protein
MVKKKFKKAKGFARGGKKPKSKKALDKRQKKSKARLLKKKLGKKTPTKPVVLPVVKVTEVEVAISPAEKQKRKTQLLAKGIERGFVTEAELLHAMPDLETDIAEVEKVMGDLEKNGVEIVDQEVASIWEQGKPVAEEPKEETEKEKKARGKKKTRAPSVRIQSAFNPEGVKYL